MQRTADIELTVFVRSPAKFGDMDMTGVRIIQGDALNAEDVRRAMDGQDILLCSLEGDVLTMAKNIVSALTETSVKRIIWITGMGIHREIKGVRGMMLNQLAKQRPDYIEAADTIAASDAVTTLLRCPGIQDGDNEVYELTKEGVQPSHRNVDRAAIAKCMADMIKDETPGQTKAWVLLTGGCNDEKGIDLRGQPPPKRKLCNPERIICPRRRESRMQSLPVSAGPEQNRLHMYPEKCIM